MPDLWKKTASFYLPGLTKCKPVDTLSWYIARCKMATYQTHHPHSSTPWGEVVPSQKDFFILENGFQLCLLLVLYKVG